MTVLPAQCLSCGYEFQHQAFHLANATVVMMSGNLITCPRCGQLARSAEGTFDVREAVVEVITGPAWTRDSLHRLRDAAERAQQHADDPAAAADALGEASPSVARTVWEAAGSGQLGNFLAALFGVAALLAGFSSQDITEDDIAKIVTTVIQQLDEDEHADE